MGLEVQYQQRHQFRGQDFHSFPHAHPLVLELDRLKNQLKDKDRELEIAQDEKKALRSTAALKDKALEELANEVKRLDANLRLTQNLLGEKNLEIKKLIDEKRDAFAAQYAAEATLRRVHASQKNDDSISTESIIAPFEAEIKMYKHEILALQEDKKALGRLIKSKESALLEAEKILQSALERALIVEEVQNHCFELKRQIEMCQEENKTLAKSNRQKVLEVEKLSRTIQELEEAILAGGVAANMIRDYQRQFSELNEEKRTLERELARVKVSASRIANVVANEWKDDNDKVMPVKQWLEEKRLLQAEMQKLRDKLAVSERTAKAEAQLKEKLKLRLKMLEEGLKRMSSLSLKTEKANSIFGFLTDNAKRHSSQPRASTIGKSSLLQHSNIKNVTEKEDGATGSKKKHGFGENMVRKNILMSSSKIVDTGGKENREVQANMEINIKKLNSDDKTDAAQISSRSGNGDFPAKGSTFPDSEDMVSGFLYDRLQKEVINLRKCCEQKDNSLNVKGQEIKVLVKKVSALTKALEVESKKVKRKLATKEKEYAAAKVDDNKNNRNTLLKKAQ